MQARYYDPVIGRFYSNDPVGTIGHLSMGNGVHGFNRYTYANNNPYRYVDPDGRAPKYRGSGERGAELGAALLVAFDVVSDEDAQLMLGNTSGSGRSRKAQMTQLKKDAKIPRSQQPEKVEKVKMTNMNNQTVKDASGKVVNTTEYTHTTTNGDKVVIQDHSAGHKDFGGEAAQSHLNVRPASNTKTGTVEGTQKHYVFDKKETQ